MGCSSSTGPVEQVAKKSDLRSSKQSHKKSDLRSSKQSDQERELVLNQARCFHDEYILGAKLGRGAFAQVRLTTKVSLPDHLQDTRNFTEAVKIIDLRKSAESGDISKSTQRAVINELVAWQQVGENRNVVQLLDFMWDTTLCYFVMERCENTFPDMMRKQTELNEKTLGFYFFQMAKAMAYIHSVGVVHRDIKPDNFFVSGKGRVLKLGDFGLSSLMPKKGGLEGIYGTAPFMSPEMLKHIPYGPKIDVWAFGVIVYVLLCGCFPYTPTESGSKAMKQAIVDNYPQPRFEPLAHASNVTLSRNVLDLLRLALFRDPSRRPTSVQLLLMPYMMQVSGSPMASPWAEEMPSLRPMFYAARKAGAFETRDHPKYDQVDSLLNELQAEHQNVCMFCTQLGLSPEKDRHNMLQGHPDALCCKKKFLHGACGHMSSQTDNSETPSTRTSIRSSISSSKMNSSNESDESNPTSLPLFGENMTVSV